MNVVLRVVTYDPYLASQSTRAFSFADDAPVLSATTAIPPWPFFQFLLGQQRQQIVVFIFQLAPLLVEHSSDAAGVPGCKS